MKVYGWIQQLPQDSPLREAAARLLDMLQAADVAPTAPLAAAVEELEGRIAAAKK